VKRLLTTSLALVLLLVAAVAASEQKPRRNRPLAIESFSSSARVISLCRFHAELFDKPVVDLLVTATDPDGDKLQYEYSTREGIISVKVSWSRGI
jgi:hypothetical protein